MFPTTRSHSSRFFNKGRHCDGMLFDRQVRARGMSVPERPLYRGAARLLWVQHHVWHALQYEHGQAQDD